MREVFNEQLVKREPSTSDLIKKIGYVLIALVVVFISMQVSLLFFFIVLILLAEIFILRYLFTNMNIEFEYIMTNSELDLDRVVDKRKRKHMYSINVKSIIAMAKYEEMQKSTEFKTYDKLVDVSSGVVNDDTYAFVVVENKKRLVFVMEPNEEILRVMKIYMTIKIL